MQLGPHLDGHPLLDDSSRLLSAVLSVGHVGAFGSKWRDREAKTASLWVALRCSISQPSAGRDDQMMLGVDRNLHVVADNTEHRSLPQLGELVLERVVFAASASDGCCRSA